jgi:hypothetical protein
MYIFWVHELGCRNRTDNGWDWVNGLRSEMVGLRSDKEGGLASIAKPQRKETNRMVHSSLQALRLFSFPQLVLLMKA